MYNTFYQCLFTCTCMGWIRVQKLERSNFPHGKSQSHTGSDVTGFRLTSGDPADLY